MTAVLAHGTFDILHEGHIKYLQYAAAQGDKLVVALSSDEMARLRKGPQRPIQNFAQREAVLQAIRYVDEVIEAPHETTDLATNIASLAHSLRVDVVVSGHEDVEDLLGKNIRFIHFDERLSSTSKIIEKILDRYGEK